MKHVRFRKNWNGYAQGVGLYLPDDEAAIALNHGVAELIDSPGDSVEPGVVESVEPEQETVEVTDVDDDESSAEPDDLD